MSAELPVLQCLRTLPSGLTAHPNSPPWLQIPPHPLLDTVASIEPAQSTDVRLAWNPHELRILFCAIDADPWATLRERDAPLYTEEVFEVFLDPVGDLQSYFEIEVNPLNAVLDLVVRRSRSGLVKNFAWRCADLRSETLRTSVGWNAELALPFRSLTNDLPAPGDRWRANFCRIDRPKDRPRELSAWSPTCIPQFHVPSRFGIVEFAT
jgi:Carbohydrate-binding family 9